MFILLLKITKENEEALSKALKKGKVDVHSRSMDLLSLKFAVTPVPCKDYEDQHNGDNNDYYKPVSFSGNRYSCSCRTRRTWRWTQRLTQR